MQSVRIQPLPFSITFLIDVTCDCGANGLRNKYLGVKSFKHEVDLRGHDVTLVCDCGKEYVIHPQQTHFHVSSEME